MYSGDEQGIILESGAQGTSKALSMSAIAFLDKRYDEYFKLEYSAKVDGKLVYHVYGENRYGQIHIY